MAVFAAGQPQFHTWWHSEGEVNPTSMVAPGSVRQSHRYRVWVGLAGSAHANESFVYEAIPRNGRGRIFSPWDAPASNTLPDDVDDGVSIEADAGVTMAWSQFEYRADVEVKIARSDGVSLGPTSNVVIRPTVQRYELASSDDGSIVIRVPCDPDGRRFSVEFFDDLIEYRSNGTNYVESGGSVVGVEPRNALLIFASPFLPEPPMTPENTHTMTPGPIRPATDLGSSQILYFPPGVYWVNQARSGVEPKIGENHLVLHRSTSWVHLSAGAYIKGAIEYTCMDGDLYASGHGVLSGEHYVYQANPTTYYQAVKSDGDSLRMWGHKTISYGQIWHCVGPTVTAPPFNTMDFFGSEKISTRIMDYKQTGAFFFQTDGPEMYPGSMVRNIFYHVNDDGVKAYHSNVSLTNATIWKCLNDPIVQIGWAAREVSGVTIDNLNVIHSRYRRSETIVPSSILGGSPFYSAGQSVDPTKTICITLSNIVVEGPWNDAPALLRITPLQNYKIDIRGAAFPDGLLAGPLGESLVPAADGPAVKMNVTISNWTVGGQPVRMDNFQSDALGRLNIDVSYWGDWIIRP